MESKVCTKCGECKSLTEYHKSPKGKGGRNSICKVCFNAYKNLLYKEDSECREKKQENARKRKGDILTYVSISKRRSSKRAEIRKRYYESEEKKKAEAAVRRIKRCPGHELHHWSYNDEHLKDVFELPTEIHRLIHQNLVYRKDLKVYETKQGELLDTKDKHKRFIISFVEYMKEVMLSI